jgi:hypothetical protein
MSADCAIPIAINVAEAMALEKVVHCERDAQ